MPGESNFEPISDLITKILLFLDRSSVQGQLLVISVSLLAAGLVAKRISMAAAPALEKSDHDDVSISRWRRIALPIVVNIIFPMLGIVLLLISRQVWILQDWYAGLITLVLEMTLLFLVYRLIVGLLYAFFPDDQIRRYHRRLFAPLFAVIVLGILLSQLADISLLGRIVVGTLYDNPVTLGALFLATVGLYFWITGAWALQDVTSHTIKARTGSESGNVDAYLTLGRYMMILAGLLVVFSALNLNPATVAAILGGLAVGISFGLREIVSNFVSGIWLLIERSVRPGDIIEVDGTTGTVIELSMRATMVRTYDGVMLIVPNQKLFTSTVKTFTHQDRSIRGVVFFRVSPKNPAEKVLQIMLASAQNHPEVLKDPAPSAAFQDVTPTYSEYRLAFWLDDISNRTRISSELRSTILMQFHEDNIELLPQGARTAADLYMEGLSDFGKSD